MRLIPSIILQDLGKISEKINASHGLSFFIGTSHWFKGFTKGTSKDLLFKAVLEKLALGKWYLHS